MSVLPFPSVVPNTATCTYIGNNAVHRSWLSQYAQSQSFGGEILRYSIFFNNLTNEQRNELVGFIAKLNGQQNRVTLPIFGVQNTGAFGGIPLVNGANQFGTQLSVNGVQASVANWIKAGDYFSIGDSELKIATDHASSDVAGNIILKFRPRIRSAPADNTAINTVTPKGRFILEGDSVEWSRRPGGFSDCSMSFIEDVL